MNTSPLTTLFLLIGVSFLSFACTEPKTNTQADPLPVEQQIFEPDGMVEPTAPVPPEEAESPKAEALPQATETEESKQTALCEFIIDWRYHGDVALLDSSGTVLKQLRNDPENEDFLMGEVLSFEKGQFAVQIKKAQAKEYQRGFMKPNEHLGFFLSNYSNDTINAFVNVHDAYAAQQITEYDPSFYQLLEVQEGVVKIAKAGETIGWISNQYVCANPYTTCN